MIASFVAILRGQDKAGYLKIMVAPLVFAGVFVVTQSCRSENKTDNVDNSVDNPEEPRKTCEQSRG